MTTTDYSARDTKLDVPYFSQYKDLKDAEHRHHACGMTCTYMVLKYFDAGVPSLDELIARGMREGGYGPSGWVHDYFVKLFRGYDFSCERREQMHDRDVEEFRSAIKEGNPVIVSAVMRLWDQKLFHMVVVTGVRENARGELEGFFYHDPARGDPHRYVSLSTFYLDWRRMAILPSTKK